MYYRGDAAGAVEHVKIAAAAGDRNAEAFLKQIGKQ
jgi:hypothetical protein